MPTARLRHVFGVAAPASLLVLASCGVPLRRNADASRSQPVYTVSDTTALFAPGVISTGSVFASSLTPDGRTVYFTSRSSDRTRTQILLSEWMDGRWTTPRRTAFSTGAHDQYPHVAPDGQWLYFSAPRQRRAAADDADGDREIWRVKLDGRSPASRDASLANSPGEEMSPSISYESTLFFALAPRRDTTRSALAYWTPEFRTTPLALSVGREITQPATPFVNASGRVLLFSGRRLDGRGRTDLYVMTRRGDGRWSAPQALGREVNGPDAEFAPALSRDETHLFFSRERFEDQRAVGTDIYVVPVRSVPVLRAALSERP